MPQKSIRMPALTEALWMRIKSRRNIKRFHFKSDAVPTNWDFGSATQQDGMQAQRWFIMLKRARTQFLLV
jgi:hypothetical protein